ncbi:MAG: Ku protein [Myxococcota bacterium]
MARPIWTGAISFGLVNVPVKLFPAISHKEIRFHQLHDEDGARIQLKRVCSKDGEEVPYEHVVKGFPLGEEEYVPLTAEELKALDPEASRTLEIEDFIDLGKIDPIYWESSYHVVPDRGADRAYALLFHAMKRARKVAIGRLVMRTKKYLCSVRPFENGLLVSTMQYADELVPQAELEGMPEKERRPDERELKMAEKLIEALSTDFRPQKYQDDYRERVRELIERKAQGKEIIAPLPAARPAKVVDLMEALQRSLEARGERRVKAQAAKTARKKPVKKSRST